MPAGNKKPNHLACFSCRQHFRHLDDPVDQLVGKSHEQLGVVTPSFLMSDQESGWANDVRSKLRRIAKWY